MEQTLNSSQLFSDTAPRHARRIWDAGVAAVNSDRLVRDVVHRGDDSLRICDEELLLSSIRRIVVVGAGKASSGMARGLEEALGPDLVDAKVTGWVNVPADCVLPLRRIHLHPARPAGINEPTDAGVVGSERILELVSGLSADDLCLVLLSGGGSALLPLPVPGISLADKQAMTRTLSRLGATINELNTVRKHLSLIKGGGLLRAATAGRMIALIISDVIGDPLEIIASGPTICDKSTADDAIIVLDKFQQRTADRELFPSSIWGELRRQVDANATPGEPRISCRNQIIGNNQTALEAAVKCARSLGYEVHSLGSDRQGDAREVGKEIAERCLEILRSEDPGPICLISGGEPVVKLAETNRPRVGGRNQEVALAALCHLWDEQLQGVAILSGGTDGEDGPTDAAGAVCSEDVRDTARERKLDPFDALSINDSYTFFSAAGGLVKTGPTHTNVMDLQVAVVRSLD
ncbi:MAG: ttuD [Schlesneria sp.]|nr:ttuD [Schlesneria sp.]